MNFCPVPSVNQCDSPFNCLSKEILFVLYITWEFWQLTERIYLLHGLFLVWYGRMSGQCFLAIALYGREPGKCSLAIAMYGGVSGQCSLAIALYGRESGQCS